MQLIVIVEGGDQVHSLEVPYDADLLTVMQLIQSEVNIYILQCMNNYNVTYIMNFNEILILCIEIC